MSILYTHSQSANIQHGILNETIGLKIVLLQNTVIISFTHRRVYICILLGWDSLSLSMLLQNVLSQKVCAKCAALALQTMYNDIIAIVMWKKPVISAATGVNA